ncbi:MAG: RHS repeat domain-containing protein [Actinomycetota bacterium]
MTTAVGFDALGRQTSYGSTNYTYDGLDRMVTRAGETFTYAGRELDAVSQSGALYGRTPAGELTSIRMGSSNYLAGENRHGDLSWLAIPNGTLARTRIYEPHGAVRSSSASFPTTPDPALGFQGDYTDPTTHDVWMGARWYDPSIATFTSRDAVAGQLGSPVTLNRYTYGNANPLLLFDPDGRAAMADAGGGYDPNDAQGLQNTARAESSMQQAQKVARAQWHRAQKPHKPNWWKRLQANFDQFTLKLGDFETGAVEGARAQVQQSIEGVQELAHHPERLVMLAESLQRDPIGTVKMMVQQSVAPIWNDIKSGHWGSATGRAGVLGLEFLLSKGAGHIGGLFRSADEITMAAGTGRLLRGLESIEEDIGVAGRIGSRVDELSSELGSSVRRLASDEAGSIRLPFGRVAEDGSTLFRGMRGAADGSPELGSSAKTLGARPGIDITVDEGGMVRPGTGGMSVNDSPTGMPEYRRPPSFGGSGKDLNMYCISSCDLGPGLRYVPDAVGHGFLEPAWEMPFEEYQGYLHTTAGSWTEVFP